MKIEREAAVCMFVALGLKNADKWNDERMAGKLARVKDMLDDDVTLEEAEQETLNAVLTAIDVGEGFEVAESVEQPESAAVEQETEEAETNDVLEAATEEAETETDDQPEEAEETPRQKRRRERQEAKEQAAEEPKEPKPKKEKKPKEPKPKKESKNGIYFVCGEVIGRRGLKAGVGEDAIDEVMAAVGCKESQRVQITISAKSSWHAIAGYAGFEASDVAGVNGKTTTRLRVAGSVIASAGMDIKIVDAVQTVNAQFGTENDVQSTYAVRNAKAAIRGYLAATAS